MSAPMKANQADKPEFREATHLETWAFNYKRRFDRIIELNNDGALYVTSAGQRELYELAKAVIKDSEADPSSIHKRGKR